MPQPSPDLEPELCELLAKYDELLAADVVTTTPDTVVAEAVLSDSKLALRFEKLQHCLHLLETDRRSRQIDGMPPSLIVDLLSAEPKKIGRFLILQRLGSGGFGIVYLAEDPILKRKVAIKIPRRETLLTPDLQQRFIRESQIAARLTHRHLVPIFEAGQSNSMSYQVTEYCAGGNLAEWLRSDNTLHGETPRLQQAPAASQPEQRRLSTRAQITAYNYWKQILNSFPMFARTWASISLRFPNDP